MVSIDMTGFLMQSLFAYGQTGSGKTFSMFGTREKPGLVPRVQKELLNRLQSDGTLKVGNHITVHSNQRFHLRKFTMRKCLICCL